MRASNVLGFAQNWRINKMKERDFSTLYFTLVLIPVGAIWLIVAVPSMIGKGVSSAANFVRNGGIKGLVSNRRFKEK